jgi:hypothetical protein
LDGGAENLEPSSRVEIRAREGRGMGTGGLARPLIGWQQRIVEVAYLHIRSGCGFTRTGPGAIGGEETLGVLLSLNPLRGVGGSPLGEGVLN